MTLLNIYIIFSAIFLIYIFFRWTTIGTLNRVIKGFLFIMAIVGVLLSLSIVGVPLGIEKL